MNSPKSALGLALAPLLLMGCGKDTRVTFELTDAPPDTAAIEHVFVTLARVEAHVAGDGDARDEGPGNDDDDDADRQGWHTITPHAGTFDLLSLQNDVRATLGELELPNGKITQIRLFIDESGENRVDRKDGTSCELELSHVPQTGVKINHPFKVLDLEDSSWLRVVIDFDVKDSLDQTDTCAFALKPVIKIKRVERD
jgi:hypothetical protein